MPIQKSQGWYSLSMANRRDCGAESAINGPCPILTTAVNAEFSESRVGSHHHAMTSVDPSMGMKRGILRKLHTRDYHRRNATATKHYERRHRSAQAQALPRQ